GSRATLVDLATGQARITHPPFLDDDRTLERDVQHHAWVGSCPPRRTQLHSDLEAQLEAGTPDHEWLAADRWADEAAQTVVVLLNRAIALVESDDPVAFMPDLIAAMMTTAHSQSKWSEMLHWFTSVHQATSA